MGKRRKAERNRYDSDRTRTHGDKTATTTQRPRPELRLRRIEGRHNALVKELRRAFARGELTADGYCAIEGLRILEEAIRSGLRFRAVFFSESAAARAERLLPQLGAQVETLLLPDKLFASVVPSDAPQGVAALVRWKEFSLEEVLAKAQAGPFWPLREYRTQEIWGQSCVPRRLSAPAASCWARERSAPSIPKSCVPRQVRYSGCRWSRTKLSEALAHESKRPAAGGHGVAQRHAAGSGQTLRAARNFYGQRRRGLPRDLIKAMDEVVAIPQAPQVDSLNVGVAASIVLYEVARQKHQPRRTRRRTKEDKHAASFGLPS